MIADTLLLVTREGWFSFKANELVEIPAWPRLDSSAVVVTDFDEAAVGVHRYEGKPAYASAVIEKHVRAEGLTEGAAHIVIHREGHVPGGCIAFYSAVPLELWQRMQQWARQQSDHCMVVSLAGLLDSDLKKGQARVLRLGRTLHLAGLNESGVFHVSASAIGRGDEDLESAVRSLATQARAELAKGVKGPLQWGCVLGASLDSEARLANVFAQAVRLECTLLAHAEMTGSNAAQVISVLPDLTEGLPGRVIQASSLAKLAWRSERLVAPLAAVTAVVGLGLMVLGVVVQGQAAAEGRAAGLQLEQAQKIEARIAEANKIEPSSSFAPVAEFARQLGDGAAYDPVTMVQLVREASGSDLRIQRIRLEPFGTYKRTFRVDGVVVQGGLTSISRFLAQTKAAGWRAEPLDPAEQSPGAFSYRLIAIAAPSA